MSTPIKTVAIYGDSISTRDYDGGYEPLLKSALSLDTVYNHSIGGSGLSLTTPDNLVSLLNAPERLHPDADLIILWHGTNDWYWGAPLGTPDSDDPATFYGALSFAVDTLRKSAPNAELVMMTPLPRWQVPDRCTECTEAYETKNAAGHTLRDYEQAIFSRSRSLCFPVVDLRTAANIHAYNHPHYLLDGIHPSAAGYEKINRILVNHLRLWYGEHD